MSAIQCAELRKFSGLAHFSDETLEKILEKHPIEVALPGTQIVKLFSTEPKDFYLINGIIRVKGKNGEETFIDDQSPLAREPILQKLPREKAIIAASEIHFIMLPHRLDRELQTSITVDDTGSLSEEIGQYEDNAAPAYRYEKQVIREQKHQPELSPHIPTQDEVLSAIKNDLDNGSLALPSPPQLSKKVLHYLKQKAINHEELYALLTIEPAVTVKIAKYAFDIEKSNKPLVDINEIIHTLGDECVRDLFMKLSTHDLFLAEHQVIQEKLHELWQHSIYVSCISGILAEKTEGIDVETAKMAGLLHDIGLIPLCNYMEHSAEFMHLADASESIIQQLTHLVSEMILSYWQFDSNIVNAASCANQWHRDINEKPDYADIVNVAQVHYYTMIGHASVLPHFDHIPAVAKVANGSLNVQTSKKLIDEARQRVNQIKRTLHITEKEHSQVSATSS